MSASDMSFQEKLAWLYGAVSVVTAATYFGIVVARAQRTPVTEVAYVWPLVWTLVACVVAMIVGGLAIRLAFPHDAAGPTSGIGRSSATGTTSVKRLRASSPWRLSYWR
jgi:hypothetical protein